MTKITEYTLDVSKWRCGGNRHAGQRLPNVLGEGTTQMLNKEGYMCCLGQFALQAGVAVDNILEIYDPDDLALYVGMYDQNFVDPSHNETLLAKELMKINDDNHDTPVTIIDQLTKKLNEYNITLKVLDPNNQLDAFK